MREGKGRAFLIVLGVVGVLALLTPGVEAAQNNRNVATEPVANMGWEADLRYTVRFSSTTAAANTKFCVSTMTVGDLTYSTTTYRGSFSPELGTSTTTTYGGRAYTSLQVISAASNVSFDFNVVDISTTSSPYLTQGQWFSPDDPVAWQGSFCLMSPSTFTVTGWMFFERPRTP